MDYIGTDGYVVYEEASDDDEDIDSSDDDDEETFWWEFDRIEANRLKNSKKAAANEFEAEMNRQLDMTISTMHSTKQDPSLKEITQGDGAGSSTSAADTTKQVKFYDDAYFDSDDSQPDGDIGEKKKKAKHPVVSNDDLLYDPDADDDDQRWVDRRRNRQTRPPPGHNQSTNGQNTKKSPNSDAVLNCPACMTTLCRDCQRHDIYKGQYRAMFVSNCKVDSRHSLKYPASRNEKRKKTVKIESDEPRSLKTLEDNPSYNPVHCSVCNTHVAVYDTDEVYHFFNVLTSFS